MALYARIEQILNKLCPAFSREVPFEWFVLLIWGLLLSHQPAAVTSYVNGLGLDESCYGAALHWFHSKAFSIDEVCQRWGRWLSSHPTAQRIKGQLVYLGDGIKVGKEGRKMPGVKGLHQESEDVNKAEWVRGHYFSALGLLLGQDKALFAAPVILKLHDGIDPVTTEKLTLVDKMATVCVAHMVKGSYAILDAYYASAKVLKPFRAQGLHLISRASISTVAKAEFSANPTIRGPGRPRVWGADIKLRELFAPIETCSQAVVWLYGQRQTVYYQCFQFYWDSPDERVLFVLTQLPNGKQIILLSSDTALTGAQVIEAYGWRFKIEVSFRSLVQLLGGFNYRFWLRSMTRISSWPKNLVLADFDADFQTRVAVKVEAFERFVNLNAIALGLLQVLALEQPGLVWTHFPRWFRTLPKHGLPSEQIVRLALQQLQPIVLAKRRPTLLLAKLLAAKIKPPENPESTPLAA
ncbi:MAG: transposase [Cyanobacteria bacterium P01_A01_bin.17]